MTTESRTAGSFCACVLVSLGGMAVGGLLGYAIQRAATGETSWGVGANVGLVAGAITTALGYKALTEETP